MNGLRVVNWAQFRALITALSCVDRRLRHCWRQNRFRARSIFTCLLRYLAMQLGTGEWTALLPANSPWTTVNQRYLGGHPAVARRRTVCYVPSSSSRRFSAFGEFCFSTCCCDPSSLPSCLKMRCKTMMALEPTYGAAAAGTTSWFSSFGFCAQLHSHHLSQGAWKKFDTFYQIM